MDLSFEECLPFRKITIISNYFAIYYLLKIKEIIIYNFCHNYSLSLQLYIFYLINYDR